MSRLLIAVGSARTTLRALHEYGKFLRRNAVANSPEYPSNLQIITHHRLHQRATYALAPMFLGDHEH